MGETSESEAYDAVGHLLEISEGFDIGMLATVADDGHLHGRPMSIAGVEKGAHAIWFLALRDSEACSELAKDPRALVTLQSDGSWLQWSGRASLVEDRAKVAALWSAALAPWFPEGPSDPQIVLVRCDVEVGEYWDQPGGLEIRARVPRVKDASQGKRADEAKDASREPAGARFESGPRAR